MATLYNDEESLEVFGVVANEVSVVMRVKYFSRVWSEWAGNELQCVNPHTPPIPYKIRRYYGYFNMVPPMGRCEGGIRFKNKEDMLHAKIKYADYFK